MILPMQMDILQHDDLPFPHSFPEFQQIGHRDLLQILAVPDRKGQ